MALFLIALVFAETFLCGYLLKQTKTMQADVMLLREEVAQVGQAPVDFGESNE